ncbi:hypothetical protein N481_03720 [Pseudoalteromonas luteoviolacea S4047-1]|uniref:PAW domain-containing protein n=1 Tax=Pseudoalteromonas luteoviolacea S4054 TaxID=1129367 RepID=A0A0F6A508_9GAMM|nr:hypothetical protein N479_23435 [Pseudoalteromonas luteoviolacea S4054]KZN62564.1 hypothetical protein N481_03720 [Pseudoalteromonas luteoviolacea S4047-1]
MQWKFDNKNNMDSVTEVKIKTKWKINNKKNKD